MLLKPSYHRWIYLGSLALIAVGLPLSKAFMSIGGIALGVNFLLEGNFRERWHRLRQEPVPVLLCSVFIYFVIGAFWSADPARALNDLRVTLPLLLFPVVIPLSDRLSKREFMLIIGLFTSTVLLTSGLSTWEFLQIKDDPSADFRSISLFTSHIRYSLMVCIAYLFLLNLAWNARHRLLYRLVYVGLAAWLSVFVFILQSLTGIVIWVLCSYLMLVYTLNYIKSQKLRTIGLTTLTVAPLILGAYLIFQVDAFYPDETPVISTLDQYTAGGEEYVHDSTNLTLENGRYVNFYLAYHELEVEWNKRSDIAFWGGTDHSGHPVMATLLRYLTSKGLRKDSVGVNSLTEQDVAAIENGVANVRFTYGNPIDNRVYTVIWEVDRMINEKRVQGHSVTQRFVFWKTGWEIFKENLWFGVGTGSGNEAFSDMYERNGTKLSEQNRLRAHNQYLTIGVLYGVVGLVLFLASIISPFLLLKNANTFLYIGFAIVIYASMLNEDTLDTQVGVTLYAFYNMLLLYGTRQLPGSSNSTSS